MKLMNKSLISVTDSVSLNMIMHHARVMHQQINMLRDPKVR